MNGCELLSVAKPYFSLTFAPTPSQKTLHGFAGVLE